MKIAVVTIYCNERFRAEAWKRYYDEYRDDVALHVIVNNGDPAETPYLEELFPESSVLLSPTNNMMASYNLALQEVLSHPDIDAVAQIVNDIRISAGGLKTLYDFLFSDPSLAMVSPVLFAGDSGQIDCYGCSIDPKNLDFIHLDARKLLGEINAEDRIVTGLPAGIFLAKREAYERFGFQDERLEMYADEVDMGLRAARMGYRLGATARAQAWHLHVNRGGAATRNKRAAFLMGRNHVYLASKYLPTRVFPVFLHRVFLGLDVIRSAVMHRKGSAESIFGWSMVKGAFAGLRMH